jgi:hypothetical protein
MSQWFYRFLYKDSTAMNQRTGALHKKPVLLLLMNDGAIKSAVTDTGECAEVILVNICTQGSPQPHLQPLTITLPDGDKWEMLANLTRLHVRTSPPGDTVVAQFQAACPEGEYDIERIEHVEVTKDKDGTISAQVALKTRNVIADFQRTLRKDYGVDMTPEDFQKYHPED